MSEQRPSAENDAPRTKVEHRVRCIFKDHLRGEPFTHHDDWFGSDADGAAAYPWLMNNCIAWVEERVVYEPEPWEPARVIPPESSAS